MKGLTDNAGEAEIAELYNILTFRAIADPGDQDVLGFDVAMNAVVRVTELDRLHQLVDHLLRQRLRASGNQDISPAKILATLWDRSQDREAQCDRSVQRRDAASCSA
jgi:hypothetical protein